VDFEFQFKADGDDWQLIGRAATSSERVDLEEAAVALRDLREGHLPAGLYRVRAGDLDQGSWRQAEVDGNGVFRPLDPS
jgi:hypothetical protein